MTTEEKNILIAEFMGYIVFHENVDYDDEKYNRPNQEYVDSIELDYDHDWNEIMPVVEKIESLPVTTVWDNDHVYLRQFSLGLNRNRYYSHFVSETSPINWIIADSEGGSKIEATYNSVVLFIQWYNARNKYDVVVTRLVSYCRTFSVYAKSVEEANDKAIEQANNRDWSGDNDDVTYNVFQTITL